MEIIESLLRGLWKEMTNAVPWDVRGRSFLWHTNPVSWDDIPERLRMQRTFGMSESLVNCFGLATCTPPLPCLRTAFTIWKKVRWRPPWSVGPAFAWLYDCKSSLCTQPVNGCVALVVLFGYASLLHVTDRKSRCCKSAEAAIFRHFKTCFPLVIQRLWVDLLCLTGVLCVFELTTCSCTCMCLFSV